MLWAAARLQCLHSAVSSNETISDERVVLHTPSSFYGRQSELEPLENLTIIDKLQAEPIWVSHRVTRGLCVIMYDKMQRCNDCG